MTAPENDGGQAFPSGDRAAFPTSTYEAGMSLRDWFAGQALAGYIAHLGGQDIHAGSYISECATQAYNLADAMLAARGRAMTIPPTISDVLNDIADGLRAKGLEARAAFDAESDLKVKMGHYGAAAALIDAATVFREVSSKAKERGL